MSFNRDDEYDAGPLQLWLTGKTGVDLKDCLNIKLHEDFIRILIKGIEAGDDKNLRNLAGEINTNNEIKGYTYLPRFAIYSKIQKDKNSNKLGIHHSFVRPSLPSAFEKVARTSHRKNFINELKKFYKVDIAIAEKKLTGIVHEQTRTSVIEEAEIKNKSLSSLLKQRPIYELGVSCTFDPTTGKFVFLNRSTMNKSIMKINPVGKNALYLGSIRGGDDLDYDAEENKFIKGKLTLAFNIERSLIEPILIALMKAVSDGINQYIDKHHLPILKKDNWCQYNYEDYYRDTYEGCYSYAFNDDWEKNLRHNKIKLAENYLQNIYIFAGFDSEQQKPGEFWPEESDEQIIFEILEDAKKNGLSFDFNKIPEIFKKMGLSSTVLMYAARRNSPALIEKLIENGADFTLKDEEGHDALWYAQNSIKKNPRIILYLSTLQNLYKKVVDYKESNPKGAIERMLDDANKVMNLHKPFYKGKTLLMCAAELPNSSLLKIIVEKLQLQYKPIDEPAVPSGHTALFVAASLNNYASVISLLEAGANPALVYDHPDYAKLDESVKYLLAVCQRPKKLKDDLNGAIAELKRELKDDKDMTAFLSKEIIPALENESKNSEVFKSMMNLLQKVQSKMFIGGSSPILRKYKIIFDNQDSEALDATPVKSHAFKSLNTFSGIYSLDDLKNYFDLLRKHISSLGESVAINLISANDLKIKLQFIPERGWRIIFPASLAETEIKNTEDLANLVKNTFSANDYAVFTTNINTSNINSKKLPKVLNNLFLEEKWLKIFDVTSTKAEARDSFDHSWLYVAALDGDFAIVLSLLKAGANPALVCDHPDYSKLIIDESIKHLLAVWRHPKKLKDDLNEAIAELKRELTLDTDMTAFLTKEITPALEDESKTREAFRSMMNLIQKVQSKMFIGENSPVLRRYKIIFDNQDGEALDATPVKSHAFKSPNTFSGIYSLDDLKNYFDLLRKHISSLDEVVAINLVKADDSKIELQFIPERGWRVTFPASLAETEIKNTKDLAYLVKDTFSANDYTVFTTNIKTSNINSKKLPKALNNLFLEEEWLKLFRITNEKITAKDSFNHSWLYTAAKMGDGRTATALLHMRANINGVTNYNATPLYIAAQNGDFAMVRFLVNNGADINIKTKFGLSPLFVAGNLNHFDIAKLLLREKGSLKQDAKDETIPPLYFAAQDNCVRMLQLLIPCYGADPNRGIKASTQVLLEHAKKIGHEKEFLELLHDKKLSSDEKIKGFTPLHAAIFFSSAEAVKILLHSSKTNVYAKTLDNINAFDFAVVRGDQEIIDTLYRHKLFVDMNNNFREILEKYKPSGTLAVDIQNLSSKYYDLDDLPDEKEMNRAISEFFMTVRNEANIIKSNNKQFFSFFSKTDLDEKLFKFLEKYETIFEVSFSKPLIPSINK